MPDNIENIRRIASFLAGLLADAAELVVTREYLDLLACRPPPVIELVNHLHKTADQIEDAVFGPHLTPQVSG